MERGAYQIVLGLSGVCELSMRQSSSGLSQMKYSSAMPHAKVSRYLRKPAPSLSVSSWKAMTPLPPLARQALHGEIRLVKWGPYILTGSSMRLVGTGSCRRSILRTVSYAKLSETSLSMGTGMMFPSSMKEDLAPVHRCLSASQVRLFYDRNNHYLIN